MIQCSDQQHMKCLKSLLSKAKTLPIHARLGVRNSKMRFCVSDRFLHKTAVMVKQAGSSRHLHIS